MVAAGARDIGLTGWLALLCYTPALGAVAFLVFGLLPSQFEENRWGPVLAGVDDVDLSSVPPKGEETFEVR